MPSIVSQFESNQCRVKAFISVIKKVNYMTTNIEYFLYKLGKNFPFLKVVVEILFMIIIFIFPNKKHLKYYLNCYYLKTTIKYYKITNSTSLPRLKIYSFHYYKINQKVEQLLSLFYFIFI